MGLEELIESRIQEAMAAGAFEGLKGAGAPFDRDPAKDLAGDQSMGFTILQNGGLLPEWLMLAREIEAETERLAALDRRHAEWVALAAETGQWEKHRPALRNLRHSYEAAARALRKKQDRYNMDAPMVALERPGIWVEHHLQRLLDRLRAAGAPDDLLTVSA